jgi:hypothetical protein
MTSPSRDNQQLTTGQRALLIFAAAGLLMLTSSSALAAIPDADGTIHACRKNSDGSLRVIDTATTANCPRGYTGLSWTSIPRPGTLYGVHIVSSEQVVESDGAQHVLNVSCPTGEQAVSLSAFVNDIPGETRGIRQAAPAHNWAGTLDVPVHGYYVYVDALPAGNPDSQLHAEILCAKVTD